MFILTLLLGLNYLSCFYNYFIVLSVNWSNIVHVCVTGFSLCVLSFLQELVDVYVEYPFFVRGQGWSSCSPQRTARLCGLQCRQLSVGDVCLALTPVSPPEPLSDSLRPKAAPKKSEDGYNSTKANAALCSQVPPELKEFKVSRKRHFSAP